MRFGRTRWSAARGQPATGSRPRMRRRAPATCWMWRWPTQDERTASKWPETSVDAGSQPPLRRKPAVPPGLRVPQPRARRSDGRGVRAGYRSPRSCGRESGSNRPDSCRISLKAMSTDGFGPSGVVCIAVGDEREVGARWGAGLARRARRATRPGTSALRGREQLAVRPTFGAFGSNSQWRSRKYSGQRPVVGDQRARAGERVDLRRREIHMQAVDPR